VHGAITKVVKRTMAHHHIDQEIDFKIIRGDRKIESASAPDRQSQPKLRHFFKRVE